MSTTIYSKQSGEIGSYIDNLLKQDKLDLDGANEYNSFKPSDQRAILHIYQIKAKQHELKSSIEDKIACIEEVTRLYHAQKCAFQDVLTKQGFDAVSEIPKDYSGRIVVLTNHGTLITIGKYKKKGRLITTNRIHTPTYDYSKKRGYLTRDLKLGDLPHLKIIDEDCYRHSAARALAINPRGADDDELEEVEAHKTSFGIGLKTAEFLLKPRELVESTGSEE